MLGTAQKMLDHKWGVPVPKEVPKIRLDTQAEELRLFQKKPYVARGVRSVWGRIINNLEGTIGQTTVEELAEVMGPTSLECAIKGKVMCFSVNEPGEHFVISRGVARKLLKVIDLKLERVHPRWHNRYQSLRDELAPIAWR